MFVRLERRREHLVAGDSSICGDDFRVTSWREDAYDDRNAKQPPQKKTICQPQHKQHN